MRGTLRSLSVRMGVLAAVAVTVASGSVGVLLHQTTKSRQLAFARNGALSYLSGDIESDRAHGLPYYGYAPTGLAGRALQSDGPVTYYDADGPRGPVMWAAQKLGDATAGYKIVAYPVAMSTEQRDLQALDRHALYAAAGTVSVLVPLAAVAAEFTGRRLRRAARTAHRIAAGDLDARISPRGGPGDEAFDLSTAVDTMADSLQRRLWSEQRFTADVAHELRTPLAGLVAAAELLPDGEATELVRDRVRVLRNLTENLLEVSRLDARVEVADFVEVPLREFLGETVADIGFPVRLTVHGAPVVRTDPRRLDRIVANLLLNAHRHGAAPIELTAGEVPAGWVELVVRDHGPGFPAELLAEGPSRFRTGAPERGRGHGLGLTIVLGQARVIGAGLDLTGAAGGGALAVVTLPRQPMSAAYMDSAGI